MLKINVNKYYNNPRLIALDESNFIVHERIREVEELLNREGSFYYNKKTKQAIQNVNDMIELEVTNSNSWEHILTELVVLLKKAPQEDKSHKLEAIKELEEKTVEIFNSINSIPYVKKEHLQKLKLHNKNMRIIAFSIMIVNFLCLALLSNVIVNSRFLSMCSVISVVILLVWFLEGFFTSSTKTENKSSLYFIEDDSESLASLWGAFIVGFAFSLNPLFVFFSFKLAKKNRMFRQEVVKELLPINPSLMYELPSNLYNAIADISEYDLPDSYKKELNQVLHTVWVNGNDDSTEIEKALLQHLNDTKTRLELMNY